MHPVRLLISIASLLCTLAFAGSGVAASVATPASAPVPGRHLSLTDQPWRGDFDAMLERHAIRVLVPYSRTLYFIDHGIERGLTAELVRDFERYVNKTYADRLGNRPLTVFLIPTTRDQLLPGLNSGRGDIAAGDLTVTAERLRQAEFVAPQDQNGVREVVVTGPRSPELSTLDDMAGKTVHVRRSSSYYDSLVTLNQQFHAAGRPTMKLVLLPDALEDEDALEMLNAGLLQILVVDDWEAKLWAEVLPRIKVRDDLVVRAKGYVGWAFRKNSPQLKQALADFYLHYVKPQGVAQYDLAQYMRQFRQITDNTDSAGTERFDQTIMLFRKYGRQYDFDPLMLCAQGYQESQLDQSMRSRVGAIGIMQIMPAVGRQLDVGSITVKESNIHAGAKYMNMLMTRYFADAQFSPSERPLFAFASYNAGPANIARMRKEAARRGLDPEKWFNNVEIVVAEKLGMQTPTYVRNIYKYYVSYRLIVEAEATSGDTGAAAP
ncbi:MAG: lytic transglycosylase F [Burkholderiaceae bacterium]|nr:lytic transglycosylase F [Burkholderiaceae bacterium]